MMRNGSADAGCYQQSEAGPLHGVRNNTRNVTADRGWSTRPMLCEILKFWVGMMHSADWNAPRITGYRRYCMRWKVGSGGKGAGQI